jgi:hypothetical protein
LTKSFITRVLATAATAGALVAFAAPSALAASGPQNCPRGSHGAVVSDPRNPSGDPIYACVSVG